MRIVTVVLVIAVLVVSIVGTAAAAPPKARINIKGVSPEMVKTGKWKTVSSGLPNVGRGSNVWLEALALNGTVPSSLHFDTLLTATWRILSAPTGSVASIMPIDTSNGLKGFAAVFVPDSLGQYEIGLVVTTANGTSAEMTQFINAAHYVGVGNIVGSADAGKGECAVCHSSKESDWKQTGHATKLERGIQGIEGSKYGPNCIGCHTTGNDKNPSAMNNGFDDVATKYGWQFPDTLKMGNWDSMKENYPEVAKLGNIQCESCHGPGGLHKGVKDKNQMASSFSTEVCGQCHDALNAHPKGQQLAGTAHARSTASGINIESKNRAPCAQCHTAQGFVDVAIKGKPLSAPYANVEPVGCTACHDPHSDKNEYQLRRPSVADACTGCHTNRISSSRGLHESHQGSLLDGSTATPFNGNPVWDNGYMIGNYSGWQLPGYDYPNSSHTDVEEKCATCHMAPAPPDSLYGLPPRTLWMKLGGHTFNVFWDGGTPDSVSKADDIVNPTGCVDCHGTVSAEFVDLSKEKIHVLMDELASLLPKQSNGTPKRFVDTTLTKIQKAGSYNYYFVLNDGSYGVHNHSYATALLKSSIEQLKLGAGASNVAFIKDVPNDQGKQVQIVWDKFPAEDHSFNRVSSYGVWRKDPLAVSKTHPATEVSTFSEMISKKADGARFILGDYVWSFVAYVPAIRAPGYSVMVPTLYDSTVTNGMAWSMFYVSGHTGDPNVMYASMPDSGYSVDNLIPSVPANIARQVVPGGVKFAWDPLTDVDAQYVAVYRGDSPGFNPKDGDPVGTSSSGEYTDNTAVSGGTYYYRLATVDFSGNESLYSDELKVVVLGVEDGGGIPAAFSLAQNYPNPFNPSTDIKYQVPQASHVRITIYNTLGVEVARVVDSEHKAGYFYAKWDGEDNMGRSVSSGIYIYKMEAGEFSMTKKMIMVR